ncbi:MAG TPA: glycoside hydrolase family 3 N-terminal domain-containing protein [Chitinophagaceae bacterium]|nr:glycoside hydrolase family 3 N-terminal domain-containing protein [Chitinophagaceae bacterium]
MLKYILGFLIILQQNVYAQRVDNVHSKHWVDSVFKSLTPAQRIAQLMIIRAHSDKGPEHVAAVVDLIQKYNVGGLCFFQGGPVRQALLTNQYQKIAKTPLLISIDGEWGLGMRLDSILNFPRQMMLGAMPNSKLVYDIGRAIGEQCKRIGIQVNYAPVVDVNNNPENPVINDRSFGADKYKVAEYGIQMMKGMQDAGIMACAKHFPGHGDTKTDSHVGLPIITKSIEQLDSLELYPFKKIFATGVQSVMVAHLYIPSIDNTPNLATSLSPKNIATLLQKKLGFKGLVFTDALEMQGVAKFFTPGDLAVKALQAGNDVLCLPGDVPASIAAIQNAIKKGTLYQQEINDKVKKLLHAKYDLGLSHLKPIDTKNLIDDINAKTVALNAKVAQEAITLLAYNNKKTFPLKKYTADATKDPGLFPTLRKKVAFVGLGLEEANTFAKQVNHFYQTDNYFLSYNTSAEKFATILQKIIQQKYDAIIVGIHNYSRRPANSYGISTTARQFIDGIEQVENASLFYFGNPYAIASHSIKSNLLVCYEDDSITQQVAAEMLMGNDSPKGKLPVSINALYPVGKGFAIESESKKKQFDGNNLTQQIDSIANYTIQQKATPGCVVLIAKDGNVILNKAYGYTTYDSAVRATTETIYDVASMTKTSATTLAIMKLYEEGKIKLEAPIHQYIKWLRNTDKANITIKQLLLHQGGLKAWIPFYKETIDANGKPLTSIYTTYKDVKHTIQVANNLFLRKDWLDTLHQRLVQSPLSDTNKYVYSDLDFILLGEVVESITGKGLDTYTSDIFYKPLGLTKTAFQPLQLFNLQQLAPTENEKIFRQQLLQGYVHDPAAAMFGGVAGHAGLFSTTKDLFIIYQMLLNGGSIYGKTLFKPSTIQLFTQYNSAISRRGFGFDKPEKDNATINDPYPSIYTSPQTFGHTGFTGTCVWVDPAQQLVYIFLSNRVYPNGDDQKLSALKIRKSIMDVVYKELMQS